MQAKSVSVFTGPEWPTNYFLFSPPHKTQFKLLQVLRAALTSVNTLLVVASFICFYFNSLLLRLCPACTRFIFALISCYSQTHTLLHSSTHTDSLTYRHIKTFSLLLNCHFSERAASHTRKLCIALNFIHVVTVTFIRHHLKWCCSGYCWHRPEGAREKEREVKVAVVPAPCNIKSCSYFHLLILSVPSHSWTGLTKVWPLSYFDYCGSHSCPVFQVDPLSLSLYFSHSLFSLSPADQL